MLSHGPGSQIWLMDIGKVIYTIVKSDHKILQGKLGVVVNAYQPSTWDVESGG